MVFLFIDVLGSTAFAPVKMDIGGNIKVNRTNLSTYKLSLKILLLYMSFTLQIFKNVTVRRFTKSEKPKSTENCPSRLKCGFCDKCFETGA